MRWTLPSLCTLALALSLAPPRAHALQPLETFLAGGRTHALDNRAAAATVHQRGAERDQAIDRLLPDFIASTGYTHNQYEAAAQIPQYSTDGTFLGTRTAVITPENQWDVTLTLEVPLVDVGNFTRVSATGATQEAAEDSAEAQRDDVDRRIVQAYYQFVAASAVLRSAHDSQGVAEENRGVVASRVSGGLASDLDLDRATAQVEQAKQTVAEAQLSQATAARQLRTLTGVSPEGDAPELRDDLHAEAPLAAWMRDVAELPNVRSARAAARAADSNGDAAWMAYVPTIAGSASERFTNATGFGQSPYYAVGVTARWRLDLTQSAAARASAAQAEAAHVAADRAEQDARDAIEDAWLRVDSLRARVVAAHAQSDASRHAARVASARYAAGTATQLDVTQAERDSLIAEVQRVQADADLAYARALLRIASGRALEPAR